jgi:hypothetical protein
VFKRTLDGNQRFIRPAVEAVGPLHPISNLTDRYGIDDVLRAIDAGLQVFETGDLLLTSGSDLRILREINASAEAS